MRFKATVYIRLRGSVSDAAGNAVGANTHRVASGLKTNFLRLNKVIDYWFEADDYETAEEELRILSDQLFANTVVEDWDYDLKETDEVGIGDITNDNSGTSKHAAFG